MVVPQDWQVSSQLVAGRVKDLLASRLIQGWRGHLKDVYTRTLDGLRSLGIDSLHSDP